MMFNISRRWDDIQIVIYGKSALIPMKIKDSISSFSEEIGSQVYSFEDYEDAYDFCKASKNVGLVFILENCGDLEFSDILNNLSNIFSVNGMPAYGVLIRENDINSKSLMEIIKNKNIIDYVNVNDFINPNLTFSTMEKIWMNFSTKRKNYYLPEKVEETFYELIKITGTFSKVSCLNQIQNILMAQSNLSWEDYISLSSARLVFRDSQM